MSIGINNKKPLVLFPIPENSRVIWNAERMVWIGYAAIKFDTTPQVNGFYIGDSRVSGIYFRRKNL